MKLEERPIALQQASFECSRIDSLTPTAIVMVEDGTAMIGSEVWWFLGAFPRILKLPKAPRLLNSSRAYAIRDFIFAGIFWASRVWVSRE